MDFCIGSCADVTRLGRLGAVDTFLGSYMIIGYLADTHCI